MESNLKIKIEFVMSTEINWWLDLNPEMINLDSSIS